MKQILQCNSLYFETQIETLTYGEVIEDETFPSTLHQNFRVLVKWEGLNDCKTSMILKTKRTKIR